MLETIIKRVEAGGNLSTDQMADAVGQIMDGGCPEPQIARFLLALKKKGETVTEVAGAARAVRQHMTPVRTSRTGIVDTCGTGGDGSLTFNVSTAAAIVTAAVGVPVAKHGNVSVSSRSGSADVLTALGVNILAPIPVVEACLEELGICFCFAPMFHTAMKHVAPVRKKLGVPTIFNWLGPLANPAGVAFQVLGVGHEKLHDKLTQAVALLGTERTLVVRGADGIDEISLSGETYVNEVTPSGTRHLVWDAPDFDLEPIEMVSIQVTSSAESAAIIRSVLDGQPGPARDVVVANAAAAVWCTGREKSLRQCAAWASEAIDNGAARDLLARWAEKTKTL